MPLISFPPNTPEPLPRRGRLRQIIKYVGIVLLSGFALFLASGIYFLFFNCGCGGTSPHNRESNNINTLAAGVKNIYAGSETFNHLNTSIIIMAKAAPDKMLVNDTTLQNGYGGLVRVEATTLNMDSEAIETPDNAYKIIYPYVPSEDCKRLTVGVGRNFIQVEINKKIAPQKASTEEIKSSEVSRLCNLEKNTMVFYGN